MEKTDKALIDIFLYGHVRPAWRKNEARYQDSWDRLMPVVEKIGKVTGYQVSIFTGNGNGGCQIQDTNSIANKKVPPLLLIVHADLRPISAVYQSVVEFIKWHNSQDTSNQPKKQ